ncbi:MAG: GNAT family N-acetyltransferase [Sporocytophaga sp.]|nr:GNAT family N-acetyltransferase [Sporocytophaga sp.]
MTDNLQFLHANLSDNNQFEDFWMLLNEYANDIMGGGATLPIEKKEQLRIQLPEIKDSYILIAYIDGQPAGLANCFTGYSTFNAAPLLNIHDFVVQANFRNKGIAFAMLKQIEEYAREKNTANLLWKYLKAIKEQYIYISPLVLPPMSLILLWVKPFFLIRNYIEHL